MDKLNTLAAYCLVWSQLVQKLCKSLLVADYYENCHNRIASMVSNHTSIQHKLFLKNTSSSRLFITRSNSYSLSLSPLLSSLQQLWYNFQNFGKTLFYLEGDNFTCRGPYSCWSTFTRVNEQRSLYFTSLQVHHYCNLEITLQAEKCLSVSLSLFFRDCFQSL